MAKDEPYLIKELVDEFDISHVLLLSADNYSYPRKVSISFLLARFTGTSLAS